MRPRTAFQRAVEAKGRGLRLRLLIFGAEASESERTVVCLEAGNYPEGLGTNPVHLHVHSDIKLQLVKIAMEDRGWVGEI